MLQNPQHSSQPKLNLTGSGANLLNDSLLSMRNSNIQYSIPKSNRWNQTNLNKKQNSKFYDLPQLRSSRSTSFGYGNKIDFSKTNVVTPSPVNYNIKSQFDSQREKRSGITFGAGRDIVKNVNTFGIKPFKLPGPQQYDPDKSIVEQSPPKYTMSGRLGDVKSKWPLSIPGPGHYNNTEIMKNNHHLSNSKFQSSPAMTFSKLQRINDYQQKLRSLKVPGPGKYKLDNELQSTAKFTHNGGRRFGTGQRKGIAEKSITPGPGAYSSVSKFAN